MRVLIAPLEFKGTLTAREVAEVIAAGLRSARPELALVAKPMADGGPGTLDAILSGAPGASEHHVRVVGPHGGVPVVDGGARHPYGESVEASARAGDGDGQLVEARFVRVGDAAFVELAEAAGLQLLGEQRDPLHGSTFGVGELIRAALDAGCTRIVLGLGGSGTNDAGAGALQALGVRLLDVHGRELPRGGAALIDLARVEVSGRDPRLEQSGALVLAIDVKSPLLGPTGASRLFGPQKGATREQVELLETALAHFAEITGGDFASREGAGAAGGTGFGLMAWAHATARPGLESIAESVALDEAIREADVVVTGEGRFDAQSLLGKGPVAIAERARALGKAVVLVAGSVEAPSKTFARVVEAAGPASAEEARRALALAIPQLLAALDAVGP